METKVELREWHALSPAQQTEVVALTISAAQERYAGNIAKAIDDCRANPPEQLRGCAVLARGGVVGFVTLKRPPLSPQWALYLKCGMADEGRDYQGRIGLERRFALALG